MPNPSVQADSSDATIPAVQGVQTGDDGTGILGIGQGNGVVGQSKGNKGFSGVHGESDGGPGVSGTSVGSVGVDAKTQTGPAALRAVHAGNGLAGDFGGNVHISGNLVVDGNVSARAMPGMGIAVVRRVEGDFLLNNFHDVTACSLTVSEHGRYVVFARVVIRNNDGDPQNASATLSNQNGSVMDRIDVRLPEQSLMEISLQGTLDVKTIDAVRLSCATFAGDAFNSSIFAVQVSDIK